MNTTKQQIIDRLNRDFVAQTGRLIPSDIDIKRNYGRDFRTFRWFFCVAPKRLSFDMTEEAQFNEGFLQQVIGSCFSMRELLKSNGWVIETTSNTIEIHPIESFGDFTYNQSDFFSIINPNDTKQAAVTILLRKKPYYFQPITIMPFLQKILVKLGFLNCVLKFTYDNTTNSYCFKALLKDGVICY